MNKINEVYNKLLLCYGYQGWWPLIKNEKVEYKPEFSSKKLDNSESFEISIGAILTQNTSWKNVEQSLVNLKRNNLLNRENILSIDEKNLGEIIRSSGYFNQKVRKIREYSKFISKVNRKNLLSIWGVGKETADSILLYAYNQPYFVVDTYTIRIFSRIGYKEKGYDEFQKLFHNNLPKDINVYKEYHALIVKHAKEVCKTKPNCFKCCIQNYCLYPKTE